MEGDGVMFLETFGVVGTSVGLYEFIATKLKDGNKQFKKELRKNITNICNEAAKALESSVEFQNAMPVGAAKAICEEVMEALDMQRQVNINNIREKLHIPNDNLFAQLLAMIGVKLNASFEYCQRDYIAWSKEATVEIKTALDRIEGKLDRVLEPDTDSTTSSLNTRPDITSLPFARNNYFTGREKTLEDISKNLDGGNTTSLTQTITGMGGFGKTQTALEYVYRCYHDTPCKYNYIHWVHAETEMEIAKSYKQFAAKMKLPITEQHDNDAVFDTVTNWMNTTDKWLFVYDNADNIPNKVKWLPNDPLGHILITTRDRQCNVGEKVDISVFTEPEAVDFLEKRTKKEQPEEALMLVKRLGYFPLALEQAAAYMVTNRKVTYEGYIKLLDKYGLKPFEKMSGVVNYQRPIQTTLKISIDKIKNEATKQLLYLCAYIAPEDIEAELFTTTHDLPPPPLGEIMENELERDDVWTQLTQYSLLEEQEDGSYTMHRLLQEIVRDEIKNDPQWALTWLNLFDEIYHFEYGDIDSHELFLYLSPHVQAFTSNAATILMDDESQEKIARLYSEGGFGYRHLGYYNQALEWYQKALDIRENVLGIEHPDTAITYNNIASVYNNQGDYTQALEWHEKALDIREKVLDIEHPDNDTATTYNNIASVHYNQSNYTQALEWFQKALVIREKVLGKEHFHTATTYNNIALVYEKQGDCTNALELYQKALTIREKILGKEHPETAATYNNIALVHIHQRDYNKALEWFQKALAIKEKVLGIEHPSTATTYNNIAHVYAAQENYPTALEWFHKALVIVEKKLGTEHPYTQDALDAIAHIQTLLR